MNWSGDILHTRPIQQAKDRRLGVASLVRKRYLERPVETHNQGT